MIEHGRAQELAAIGLDFELDPGERAVLDRHLADCEACRAVAVDLGAIQNAIAELPTEDAPARLRRQILDPAGERARRSQASRWTLPRIPRLQAFGIAAAAAVVAIAIVASQLPWQAGPTPSVAIADPTSTPSGESPTPGATAGPSATERPPILAYTPRAELTPVSGAGPVVAPDAEFRLVSVDGSPAVDLAARLSVKPALELAVEPEPDGTAVRIRPATQMQPGTVYRFTLAGADGRPQDSWAFQTEQAVRVVATTPDDTETDVPLDTGIEITFDQDGVVDPASHVTIQPLTPGRFEWRDRTLAFVPQRLKAATVYTVTVTRGVRVEGSDEVLAEDFRFRFETAAQPGRVTTTFGFPDDVLEAPTAGRATLPIWAFRDDDTLPSATAMEVYRFADRAAAIDGFRQLRRSSRWARWSIADAVPTAGLRRVMSFRAALQRGGESLWFRLPDTLAAGWYLVQQPSRTRPTQVILQVTDVAGYLSVSDGRTLVWANDLADGRPLSGATVTTEGSDLGRTDADGLLLADTPAPLRADGQPGCAESACDRVVIVRSPDGRSMFMPADNPYGMGVGHDGSSANAQSHWLVYHTDRLVYRRTDTVNVWGMVRDRASGAVPETVDVALVVGFSDPTPPPIASLRLRPSPTGAFTGSLPIANLPEGSYDLILRAGADVIGSTSVQVARILKPAYKLDLETGRRVYIEGDRIRVTSHATFYEGTPVPGVRLRIDGRVQRNVTTDRTGTATFRTVAHADRDIDGSAWDYQSVGVNPARAEEGDIAGSTQAFLVFPSSRTIRGEATIASGRVRLQGTVHLVDRDRLETEIAGGLSPWDLDPRGKPVTGATVAISFNEEIPSRVQAGTEYDWIEKKVVPIYEYEVRTQEVRTMRVRTSANGSFSASIPDPGRRHDFQIRMTVGDPDGHPARTFAYASAGRASTDTVDYASLAPTSSAVARPDGYAIGDRIDLTVTENRRARGGRYLFELAQRGLREATVQGSPRLVTTFERWAVPNVVIAAVHFTGTRYILSDEYYASFRATDREVDVTLTPDRARYSPRDPVELDVRTRDHDGAPVAASVILQAVDAKLFDIGAAADADPLPELYGSLASGVRTRFASHRLRQRPGEGGDTAGGGGDERIHFRDALLFEVVETGADGRARASFRLSDDLTSWRVSGAAITDDLGAGIRSIEIPVGLPFFVDASIAPEYLVGDRPSIQVRAYGQGLAPGADVRLTVTSDSLGLTAQTIRTKAFETVTVPMPKLSSGLHSVTITASAGSGTAVMRDQLTRSFNVIASRLERARTTYTDGIGPRPVAGGAGLTSLVISDSSAGRYLPLLLDVAGNDGARLERALGAAMASSLLTRRYGAAGGAWRPADLDGDRYQAADGGIAPLPHSSSDLTLTSLVAIVSPEAFRTADLRAYLGSVRGDPKATRERRMYALAGLAGVGAPVLPQIRVAAADRGLTVRERLMIGLGAAALGDAATARTIATELWAAAGEERADQAHLRVGDTAADSTDATARMALLTAAIGDGHAPALWTYVEANPSTDVPYDLLAVAYVERLIDRLPVEPASFAYVIDGKRTVVELGMGESFQLTLTTAQRANLLLETIEGAIGITTTWAEPVTASSFERDADITIRRSRTPAAMVGTADLVRVDLTVRFGPKAPTGCHQVTEQVPSGLIPLNPMTPLPDDEASVGDPRFATPYAVDGQRVSFCAEPTKKLRTVRLRYYARVITPGTYLWEPAVVESRTSADRAALTARATVRIR